MTFLDVFRDEKSSETTKSRRLKCLLKVKVRSPLKRKVDQPQGFHDVGVEKCFGSNLSLHFFQNEVQINFVNIRIKIRIYRHFETFCFAKTIYLNIWTKLLRSIFIVSKRYFQNLRDFKFLWDSKMVCFSLICNLYWCLNNINLKKVYYEVLKRKFMSSY